MTLNKAVLLNTLRSHFDAPVRLVIAGLLTLILYALVTSGVTVNGTPMLGVTGLVSGVNVLVTMMLWLLGLGSISRDISGGSIQLVLLRPLTRATYVLSKWGALAGLGLAVLLVIHAAFLAHHGLDSISADSLALLLAAQVLQVAAIAAVITLFSCVPMNFGELGLLILSVLAYAALKLLNMKYEVPGLDQGLALAWRVIFPAVRFAPSALDSGQGDLLLSLGLNAAIAVLALGGAIRLIVRREFTYAEVGG